jgi:hemolysin III
VTGAASAPSGAAQRSGAARVAAAVARPRLRGWSHLVMSVPALAGTVMLVLLARGDAGRQLALLVYGLSSVLLFATSGVYHVGTWSPPVRARLRRLDHANIFLLIAGTYTPVTLTLLSGAWKVAIICIVWGLAVAGVAVVVSPVPVPRWLLAACYVGMGWVAIIALPVIAGAAGAGPIALIIAAGILYSTGAVLYATRWPRLSPRWFGYHEVFHLLVIAANALFFTLMVVEVVPHSH